VKGIILLNEAVERDEVVREGLPHGDFSSDGLSLDESDGFVKSMWITFVSEIGDETFVIAAILAMRHARWVVFSSTMAALGGITVLSVCFGFFLPWLFSQHKTRGMATILYVVFALRLLWIGETHQDGEDDFYDIESQILKERKEAVAYARQRVAQTLVEVFILIFFAEWGDRSQIAIIALAAEGQPWGVASGAILGHCLSTAIAVSGGRFLASRVSAKVVSRIGAATFVACALMNLYAMRT